MLKHKKCFNVNENLLARALKNKFSPSSDFSSLYIARTTEEFLAFIKAKLPIFVNSSTCASLKLKDCLIFKGEQI